MNNVNFSCMKCGSKLFVSDNDGFCHNLKCDIYHVNLYNSTEK